MNQQLNELQSLIRKRTSAEIAFSDVESEGEKKLNEKLFKHLDKKIDKLREEAYKGSKYILSETEWFIKEKTNIEMLELEDKKDEIMKEFYQISCKKCSLNNLSNKKTLDINFLYNQNICQMKKIMVNGTLQEIKNSNLELQEFGGGIYLNKHYDLISRCDYNLSKNKTNLIKLNKQLLYIDERLDKTIALHEWVTKND